MIIENVPAFTNLVGTRRLSDFRADESFGKVWDSNSQSWVSFHRYDRSYPIDTDLSEKPPVLHWDHHSNSYYTRGIQKVLVDRPGRHRVSWYNPVDGHTASYDWEEISHLSGRATPLTSFPSVPLGIFDNMLAQAKTECLNKLLEEKAQIGAALGEARQTVNMFSDLVTDGVRYLRAFKHGNLKAIIRRNGGKSSSKSIADAWLQYSYGWKPLADDIHTAQANVHRVLAKDMIIAAKRGVNYEMEIPYSNPAGDYSELSIVKQQVLCELGAYLDHPEIAYLDTFGLINPAVIAWELVPWSFAVDWFIPVGRTLEAITATMGLRFRGGRINTRRGYKTVRTYNPGRRTPWRECLDVGEYQETGFGFQRIPLLSFPAPQLYADMTPYSTTRALNALALFRQFVGGK